MIASPSVTPAEEDRRIEESQQRIRVTTRLLLRCMWHCLVTQHQHDQSSASSARRRPEEARDIRGKRPPTPSRGFVTTTSRSVYREVMLQQRGRKASDATGGLTATRNQEDCERNIFSSSLSFTLLRSTLTMSLALLFVRRLFRVACVVRRSQLAKARGSHLHCMMRRCLIGWRQTTRVAWRWRRWMLRRCVDHWWRYAQSRSAIRNILQGFLLGLRCRLQAYRCVAGSRLRRIVRCWSHKWNQRVIQRQLAERCAQYMTVKQGVSAAFMVRSELLSAPMDVEVSESRTIPAAEVPFATHSFVESEHRILASSHVSIEPLQPHGRVAKECLMRFCFQRWVRRTEAQLNAFFACAAWRRRCSAKCFSRWKARCALATLHPDPSASLLGDTGALPHPPPAVVFVKQTASPTETMYRLKGFMSTASMVRRHHVLCSWKQRWHTRVADRSFVHHLLSRALAMWLHKTADRRIARGVKHQVFELWRTKYYVRQQAVYAGDLHRAVVLQKVWRSWTVALQSRWLTSARNRLCAVRCLSKWRTSVAIRAAAARYSALHRSTCFIRWRHRTVERQRRAMQELVAEALWQHITLTTTLCRWRERHEAHVEGREQEHRILEAIDERYFDRLRKKCFLRWQHKKL
jgi:hypothetical protein